jgi:hypothetical protein
VLRQAKIPESGADFGGRPIGERIDLDAAIDGFDPRKCRPDAP